MCDMMQSWLAKKCPCVWSTLSGTTFISEACFSFKMTELYLGLKTLEGDSGLRSPGVIHLHPPWTCRGQDGRTGHALHWLRPGEPRGALVLEPSM